MSVSVSVTAGVATLTLERPAKRNAIDRAMLVDLDEAVSAIEADPTAKVVVVRGAGGTFSAGADIADWVAPPHDVAAELSELGKRAFRRLAGLPQPSVAAIEGTAIGGGFELALACDVRIATHDARLGLPELGLGNLPSWGGLARLVAVAGLGVTRHLLLTGELISGARAAELLVVSNAVQAADLEGAVDAVLTRLAAAEPRAVALSKQLLGDFERELSQESAIAAYTAGLESSRARKQDFLDRKAAARAARNVQPR